MKKKKRKTFILTCFSLNCYKKLFIIYLFIYLFNVNSFPVMTSNELKCHEILQLIIINLSIKN
jgi:hypothetical protein